MPTGRTPADLLEPRLAVSRAERHFAMLEPS
jgi:hypothetical protein